MNENEEAAAHVEALHELSENDPHWAQRVVDTMALMKIVTDTPYPDK